MLSAPVDGVPQPHAGHPVLAEHLGDLAVPGELDLRVGERAVLHDLGGAQRVPAVHDRDRLANRVRNGRLLHGRVAAADDGDVLLAEEEAVTGGAPGDAVAGQPLLARHAELAVARAGRDDHRLAR